MPKPKTKSLIFQLYDHFSFTSPCRRGNSGDHRSNGGGGGRKEEEEEEKVSQWWRMRERRDMQGIKFFFIF